MSGDAIDATTIPVRPDEVLMKVSAVIWSDELRPLFEAQTGKTSNAAFGAYVLMSAGTTLFAGLGNLPGDNDGALVVRVQENGLLVSEWVLEEQGCHDMQALGDHLWVPGTDPTDDWTSGNLYHRSAGGTWSKIRTQTNVIHSLGLSVNGDDIYVSTGSHTGDNKTWLGQVLHSIDGGQTWASLGTPAAYRVWDVIEFDGQLYASCNDDSFNGNQLRVWSNGVWIDVPGAILCWYPRMVVFGDLLVAVDTTSHRLVAVNAAGLVTHHDINAIGSYYNPLVVIGEHLYYVGADGYIWRTSDMTTWERYTYVANAVALGVAPDGNLLIADKGAGARIWKASIV